METLSAAIYAPKRWAMRAPDRLRRDHFARVRGQCPSAARATEAAMTRAAALGLLHPVRLLPFRGRHAGIIRRLRWHTKLRLKPPPHAVSGPARSAPEPAPIAPRSGHLSRR